jgi:5-(carboxyamino)imidazole ribonucleotide synthase
MSEPRPVAPGGTIGILGGGQLGRMLALAAAELGLSCHIYSPEEDSPAFDIARVHTRAGWNNEAALAAFAANVDVITFEFENVPAATAAFLTNHRPVFPKPDVLAVTQDRLAEKRLFARLGIDTPAFAEVNAAADIAPALAGIGAPAVLKTRRLGYDGKGQAKIEPDDDPAAAWKAVGETASIVEQFVPFEREISAGVARGRGGAIAIYDISENEHRDHILATARVPAAIADDIAAKARDIGARIAEALDHVGMLAVELFVAFGPNGHRLLANEIAPRVHNSFHWTQDACLTSQFEQHIRAICGWPLGDPARHSDAEMTNLIGGAETGWETLAAQPGARLHLYGKAESRPGRKMGHVTRLFPLGAPKARKSRRP